MDNASKNKWQIRAAALIIFLLGFVAGGLALNTYQSWSSNAGPRGKRGDHFARMLDRLQLTPEQRPQVEKILSDTRVQFEGLRKESEPKVEEIRRQADERLQKVLTPEQWQQFQQLKEEMRQRRRGKGERGDRPRSPDGH